MVIATGGPDQQQKERSEIRHDWRCWRGLACKTACNWFLLHLTCSFSLLCSFATVLLFLPAVYDAPFATLSRISFKRRLPVFFGLESIILETASQDTVTHEPDWKKTLQAHARQHNTQNERQHSKKRMKFLLLAEGAAAVRHTHDNTWTDFAKMLPPSHVQCQRTEFVLARWPREKSVFWASNRLSSKK
jgi:hypothetical protein